MRGRSHFVFLFLDSFYQVGKESARGLRILRQLAPVVVKWRPISQVGVHELIQVFLDESVQMVAKLFQVRLPLLKQVFLPVSHCLHAVVAIRIRPLEHIATLDHHFATFLKKFQLLWWVALVFVQQLHLVFQHGHQLDRQCT